MVLKLIAEVQQEITGEKKVKELELRLMKLKSDLPVAIYESNNVVVQINTEESDDDSDDNNDNALPSTKKIAVAMSS